MRETIKVGGKVEPRGKRAKKAGLTPGELIKLDDFKEDRFKP